MLAPTKQPPLGEKQWQDLRQASPENVCRCAAVEYDQQGFYTIPFMHKVYRVYPETEKVEGSEGNIFATDAEFILLLLVYLLSAQETSLAGKWVTERDLKDGNLFFRGPHVLPVKRLIERFGANPQAFSASGQVCGGEELKQYGDVALKFQVLPRIPIICVLWAADDEFPARVACLFDPSITVHLPLDVILALVRCLAKNIVETDKARES